MQLLRAPKKRLPLSLRLAITVIFKMPKSRFETLPGAPYPLGATADGAGVNFAIFSEHATAATLCLFGGVGGNTEVVRIPLADRTEHIWHGYVPGVRAGQRYGYRFAGPYDPPAGHRFNPAKLLLDPYARALDRDAAMARFDVRLSLDRGRRRRASGLAQQCARDAQVRGRRFGVRLGGRSQARNSVERPRDLRGAREGHDCDASRSAAARFAANSRGSHRRPQSST